MTDIPVRHVWLNGRLVPAGAAQLSVYDRGFQLGDGVFEALRARRGVAIELAGHLARLRRSAASMSLELPFDDAGLAAGLAELLATEGLDRPGGPEPPGDAVVRITVSRGFDPTRNILPAAGAVATVAIQAWPFTPPRPEVLRTGTRLVVSAIPREPSSPMSAIKSTSRADLVYARLEAQRAGADDAVFLTPDGRLTEATTANVLVVSGGVCTTPQLSCGILAGTTRAWLLEHGGAAGLRMVEGELRLDDLFGADEVALCASVGGVIPVCEVAGRRVGEGRPGPRTMALREARERWIDEVSLAGATGSPAAARP